MGEKRLIRFREGGWHRRHCAALPLFPKRMVDRERGSFPKMPTVHRETEKRVFLLSGLVTALSSQLGRKELDHGVIEALVKCCPVEPRRAFADLWY